MRTRDRVRSGRGLGGDPRRGGGDPLAPSEVLRALFEAHSPPYPLRRRALELAHGEQAASAVKDALCLACSDGQIAPLVVDHLLGPEALGSAIECSLIASVIGARLEIGGEDLRDLALAALLAETGMALLPRDLIRKPGLLNEHEREQVRSHVSAGVEVLRPLASRFPLVLKVAAQHHEQVDGSGYPRGLEGEQICVEAQAVALSRRYLAATTSRPQRPAVPPHEALELILTLGGRLADWKVISAFASSVAIYPLGSLVQLSDGRIGRVSAAGPANRPRVEIVWDHGGRELAERVEVDLWSERTLFIRALA